MAGPGPLQNITSQEQLLVERAIGAAVLDKLRGNPASLAEAYRSQGGSDETSIHALNAIDAKFQTWDISAAGLAAAKTASVGSFSTAYQHWGLSHVELALVERTIGVAFLRRFEGEGASYTEVYRSLGGRNQHTLAVLGEVDPLWARVNADDAASALTSI